MKKYWSPLLILLASTSWVCAQIGVEVWIDQEQYLRDESIIIKVGVNNLSGQTIQFPKDADWLSFALQTSSGKQVKRIGELSLKEACALNTANAATWKIDISPLYDISAVGEYSIVATVRIKAWDQEFSTKPKTFEIVPGFKMWEKDFGVPRTNGAPEVRKYILQKANFVRDRNPNKSSMMLYLRVADAQDVQVFKVIPVGPMVSFSQPEAIVDNNSNLHILTQTGGWSFIYIVSNPEGTVLIRQRHEYSESRPVLRMNQEGKVMVLGGNRRITPEDLPPPAVAERSTNNAPTPIP